MTKNILVTGGAGYIGSHVVKLLGEKGHAITVVDNLSTGNRGAVLYGNLVELDLANMAELKALFAQNKFDAVMHFAGSIKVPESVENPFKYYQNNSVNTFNLLSCCKEFGVENFIFSSTAAVYGDLQDGVAREETPRNPINPYGRSKLMTEWMLEDYKVSHPDFNYMAIRYFNVCGADPDGRIGQAFPEPFHLINVACEAATGKREKLCIFGDDYPTTDGTCERDYIHVTDLAAAHLLALEYVMHEKKSDVVNCGYGHGFSVKEIIEAVKATTKVDFPVEHAARRAGDPPILVAKADKIRSLLHWQPKYDDINYIIETVYNWEQGSTINEWRKAKA